MFNKKTITNILFLDIETVSEKKTFFELNEEQKNLWNEKTLKIRNDKTAEEFYEKAGIWAEFGKIVCISLGYFDNKVPNEFRVTSITGNEPYILNSFNNIIKKFKEKRTLKFCGHNGKEFDFPYIARRMIINNISLPPELAHHGKKPWEIPHIDTLELWKFGDYKHYTSLKLLASILGLENPKDDIDGSKINHTFYVEKNIQKIITYCQKDVITTMQVFFKILQISIPIYDIKFIKTNNF